MSSSEHFGSQSSSVDFENDSELLRNALDEESEENLEIK